MIKPNQAHSVDELHRRLESLVYMVLTVRRSVRGPAEALAGYPQPDQEPFLVSVQFITGTSVELASNFCHFAPPALGLVPAEHWHRWVLHLMDRYDQGGVRAAIVSMQDVDAYVEELGRAQRAVRLENVAGVPERFVLGLSGRLLKLERPRGLTLTLKRCTCPPSSTASPIARTTFDYTRPPRCTCGRRAGSGLGAGSGPTLRQVSRIRKKQSGCFTRWSGCAWMAV